MKVHLEGMSPGSGPEAYDAWKREGLIPDKTKACTGFMMPVGNESNFTTDPAKVTCGLCLRRWNKFVNDKSKQDRTISHRAFVWYIFCTALGNHTIPYQEYI